MSDDVDTKRLDRQGRQQGLIVEQLQRALLRISEAEHDIEKIHARLDSHDDQLDRQADRMDVYGEILTRLEAARAHSRARPNGAIGRASGRECVYRFL